MTKHCQFQIGDVLLWPDGPKDDLHYDTLLIISIDARVNHDWHDWQLAMLNVVDSSTGVTERIGIRRAAGIEQFPGVKLIWRGRQ